MITNTLFFTTFNKNGYELYGKTWIQTIIPILDKNPLYKCIIFYEGFIPSEKHKQITYVDFNSACHTHAKWKEEYLSKSNHSQYITKMTVRFSHKAFVIHHVLDKYRTDYLIWVDGDVEFKDDNNWSNFPKDILQDKFMACQIEQSSSGNHVESGLLIWDAKHKDLNTWKEIFKENYAINNIMQMKEPYDGFVIFKSIDQSKLSVVNLNPSNTGIQSDPGSTFIHEYIRTKFVHNIGWTGKNEYENFKDILQVDEVYKMTEIALFGNEIEKRKKREDAFNKLNELRKLKK